MAWLWAWDGWIMKPLLDLCCYAMAEMRLPYLFLRASLRASAMAYAAWFVKSHNIYTFLYILYILTEHPSRLGRRPKSVLVL